MPEQSLLKNYIYNLVLTVANLIFPLIVFAYISRTIGPEGIGKVNFASTLASYFVLFGVFGVNTYGVRTIASLRHDPIKLKVVFNELFLINCITISISFCLYLFFILINYKTKTDLPLFLINGVTVFFALFSFDWLFQGLENYKYITIRSLIIKTVVILLIFMFVKKKEDYIIYALLFVLGGSANYLFNFYYARKLIGIDFRNINIKRHFPVLIHFAVISIIVSLYSGMDKLLLGYLAGDYYVGLYVPANRISQLLLGLITSMSSVLYPRMSNIHYNGTREEINSMISKSLHAVLLLAVPLFVGTEVLADNLIWLLSGEEFLSSIGTLRIEAFMIIPVAIANIAGTQALVATGNEKKYLFSVVCGSIVFLVSAFLCIPILKQNGAAVSLVLAEMFGVILELILARSYFRNAIKTRQVLSIIMSAAIMGIVVYLMNSLLNYSLLSSSFLALFGAILYFLFLLVLKDSIVLEFKDMIKTKICKKT